MTMENMFPSLYEGIEDEWSFFYSDEGVTYFGQKEQTESSALLDDILKQRPTEDKIQTIYKKLDGKNLVISYMQVRELSGTLICVKDITKNVHNVYFMRDVFVAVMLAFILLICVPSSPISSLPQFSIATSRSPFCTFRMDFKIS